MSAKHLSIPERSAYRSLEDVIGCKWSAAVVGALHRGVNRPGKLERYIPGISTKVLTERLRRLLEYGLITRDDQSAVALHIEYHLTTTGERLAAIIEQLHALETEHGGKRAKQVESTVKASPAVAASVTSSITPPASPSVAGTEIAQEKSSKLTASKARAGTTSPALSKAITTTKKHARAPKRP